MFAGKPIIGIVGGIGSGKSFIAKLFADEGCLVISSDEQVSEAYADERIRRSLRDWWGDEVIAPDGSINRRLIASKVFNDPEQRKRLEDLIHPYVHESRQRVMQEAANDAAIKAFVWDTPLLFEVGLNKECDAVVFVDTPLEVRQGRVKRTRGWEAAELVRREKSQWPLDKKRGLSDYVISNTADRGVALSQVTNAVKNVISRILAKGCS